VDLWVWIAVFVAAWLLEALAGAAKKRRQTPPQRSRQRSVPGGPPTPVRRSEPRPVVQRPVPRREPPLVVYLPEPESGRARRGAAVSAEGVSAELPVSTPAAESTTPPHRRVVGTYGPGVPAEIGTARQTRPHRFALRPATLRDAVVWAEILGPPRSER
jgi:hypothetical protein